MTRKRSSHCDSSKEGEEYTDEEYAADDSSGDEIFLDTSNHGTCSIGHFL